MHDVKVDMDCLLSDVRFSSSCCGICPLLLPFLFILLVKDVLHCMNEYHLYEKYCFISFEADVLLDCSYCSTT